MICLSNDKMDSTLNLSIGNEISAKNLINIFKKEVIEIKIENKIEKSTGKIVSIS